MKPTSLLDNVDAKFMAAISKLQPKSAPQRVLVYVESDDDIAFWRHILSPFEQNKCSFDIQLPIKNALEKGKIEVLKFADRVGKNLILCVDSDYDYLLQQKTATSTLINSNPYIFQTYAYSIENLLCYAESLANICTQATKNNNQIIDFEELLKFYSKTIYQLFLWSVHFAFIADTTSFTIEKFCATIKILNTPLVSEKFMTAFENLKTKVDEKIAALEISFSNEIAQVEALKQSLQALGVEETNVYLFVQGHTIKDNVVLMFLKSIFEHLKNEKIQQIKSNAKNFTVISNEIDHYKKQTIPIAYVLSTNTEYKSCFLYQQIIRDLNAYIQNF